MFYWKYWTILKSVRFGWCNEQNCWSNEREKNHLKAAAWTKCRKKLIEWKKN